jgi:hypothetical protein
MGDGCGSKMAQFWDCNPVCQLKGHMMFAKRKLPQDVGWELSNITCNLKKWFTPILKHQLDV